jgi:hypothetical protein
MRPTSRSLIALFSSFMLCAFFGCGGSGGNEGPGFLPLGDQPTCKTSCTAHATPTCTTECQSSCSGICHGTMASSNFAEVDSIDCTQTSVTFHEGGSELTCTP